MSFKRFQYGKGAVFLLLGAALSLLCACKELPSPNPFESYREISVMPDENGYIDGSNDAGIKGQWYSYIGLDSTISPEPLDRFALNDDRICASGEASVVKDREYALYYGAGIGFYLCYSDKKDIPPEFPFTLSECLLSPLSPDMHTKIAGIAFDLEMNRKDHPPIRVIFREWRREESPYVKVETSGSHRALFRDAGFSDYIPDDSSPSHPGEIHSILFQVPSVDTEAQDFDFCISNLRALVNPEPDTDVDDYDGTDTYDAGQSCENEGVDADAGLTWIRIEDSDDANAFEILKTEVTAAQYKQCSCCGSTEDWDVCSVDNRNDELRPNEPANCVDWYQAEKFCNWVGGRLPSESEWTAAAAGGEDVSYPWGDEAPTCSLAVMYTDEEDNCDIGTNRPAEVCSTPLGNTELGLCDMAGNVWEWVADWYPEEENVPNKTFRMLKGGSYFSRDECLKVETRSMAHPFLPRDIGKIGFRCVRQSD